MTQIIEVPGQGNVEFPDGMSDEDIAKAIRANEPEPSWAGVIPRAVENIVTSPYYMGKQIVQDVARIPGNIGQIRQIDWRDIPKAPWQVVEATRGTVNEILRPVTENPEEVVGGLIGGTMVPGPLGIMGGATVARGIKGLVKGELPQNTTQGMLETAGTTGMLSYAPVPYRYAKKVPGKYLSLPSERHAAAAEAMQEIPGKFGVDDALVKSKYATAEQLASLPPQGTAPLASLGNAVARMDNQLQTNPLSSMRDTPLSKQVAKLNRDVQGLGRDVSAKEADAIIKSVNVNIGATEANAAEQAVWKQMLAATHDDMIRAASSTGDPAFAAYSDAISTARLNFLKRDIEKVIEASGIKEQRTGASVVAAPGNVKKWLRLNPEWQGAVEKVQPGLLDSIRADLEEIIPIANYKAQGIPGQQFGSGRLLVGAALGRLLQRSLGLPPGTAEAAGALIGGLSPWAGIKLTPDYIRSSFRPTVKTGSRGLGLAGTTYESPEETKSRIQSFVPKEVRSAMQASGQWIKTVPESIARNVIQAAGNSKERAKRLLADMGYDPEAEVR